MVPSDVNAVECAHNRENPCHRRYIYNVDARQLENTHILDFVVVKNRSISMDVLRKNIFCLASRNAHRVTEIRLNTIRAMTHASFGLRGLFERKQAENRPAKFNRINRRASSCFILALCPAFRIKIEFYFEVNLKTTISPIPGGKDFNWNLVQVSRGERERERERERESKSHAGTKKVERNELKNTKRTNRTTHARVPREARSSVLKTRERRRVGFQG